MVNNNPGNIRLIKKADGTCPKPYTGEIRPGDIKPGKRAGFRKFVSIDDGAAAMYKLLYQYYLGRGLNTLSKILPVYAPSSDNNNPERYARNVAKMSGVGVDQLITSSDLVPIVKAMTRIEKGEALPAGTAERVYGKLKDEGYFSKYPLPYSAYSAVAKTDIKGGSNVLSFWQDRKKRTIVLTVSGALLGTYLLYRYNANRKRKKLRSNS